MLDPSPIARKSTKRRALQFIDNISHGAVHKYENEHGRNSIYQYYPDTHRQDQSLRSKKLSLKRTSRLKGRRKKQLYKNMYQSQGRLGNTNYYIPTAIPKDSKKLQKIEKKIRKKQKKQMKKQLKKSMKNHKHQNLPLYAPIPQQKNHVLAGKLLSYVDGRVKPSKNRPLPTNRYGLKKAGTRSSRRIQLLRRLLLSPAQSRMNLNRRRLYAYSLDMLRSSLEQPSELEYPYIYPKNVPVDSKHLALSSSSSKLYSASNYVAPTASEWENMILSQSHFKRVQKTLNPMNHIRAKLLKSYVYRKRDVVASLTQAPLKILVDPKMSFADMMRVWIKTILVPLMWLYANRNSKARQTSRQYRKNQSQVKSRLTKVFAVLNNLKDKHHFQDQLMKQSTINRLMRFIQTEESQKTKYSFKAVPKLILLKALALRQNSMSPKISEIEAKKHGRQGLLGLSTRLLRFVRAGGKKIVKSSPKNSRQMTKVGLFAEW